MKIRHIWFDFSDTIAHVNHKKHDEVVFQAFEELSGIADSPQRRTLYMRLFEKHARSNSAVFVQELGAPSGFWSARMGESIEGMYVLADADIPRVIAELAKFIPVSIFSNIDVEYALKDLGIGVAHFTNILPSSELRHPKPHTEGYKKLVELSALPAGEVLYIGDIEDKDIVPAKSVGLRTGMIWNDSSEADFVFKSFEEILTAMKANIFSQ